MPRPIRVCIDPTAMSYNLGRVVERLRQYAAPDHSIPKVWAVIKANAYGHGIEVAVQAFSQADGLAMLDFEEAVRCRQAGWDKPILMLEGVFEPADWQACLEWGLWPVVHHQSQIDWLRGLPTVASAAQSMQVFLKLDTGMHRLGFSPEDYVQAFTALSDLQTQGKLGSIGHMTHFACADDADGLDAPLQIFQQSTRGLPGVRCVANSAAILNHTEQVLALHQSARSAHVSSDVGSWVRPGICLYGASPLAEVSADTLGLRPSMTLSSQVLSVRTVAEGEGIGYSAHFRAPRSMRVAVVACGYADGYPRHAPSGTPVVVNGHRVGLVGRVSMDMLAVDVSAIGPVNVGDPVVLWGSYGLSVDEVASLSGTIGYSLLTAVAPRVKRQVIGLA